jgi:glucose/arabinose dehydrogenase
VILRVRQDGSPASPRPFKPYCTGETSLLCQSDGDCGANGPCRTEVARYRAYGIRNCFGLARDPATGRIWFTDNGPGNYDEVNRLIGGMNGGWNRIMGPIEREPWHDLDDLFHMPGSGITYRDPEFSLLTPVGITGIVFPYGSRLGPAYDDKLIVAEVNLGQLYALPLDAERKRFDFSGATGLSDLVADSDAERDQFRIGSGFQSVTDLELAPDGSLYVVSFFDGTLYRIDGPGSSLPVPGLAPLGLGALALLLLLAARVARRWETTR